MARDNHPRIRQASKLKRKQGNRAPADRILIVTEGTKTEKNYFEDVRKDLKLPTANIKVLPCSLGTCPLQVAKYALELFNNGDSKNGIQPKSFEKVYAVFDKDEHAHYFDALAFVDNKKSSRILNDQRKLIEFHAIISVPSFELWLLLHFKSIVAPIHRNQALKKLKEHICEYAKGISGVYAKTKPFIGVASCRANQLSETNTPYDDNGIFTNVNMLMEELSNLGK